MGTYLAWRVLSAWADIGRAERLLGWRPQHDFEDGVRCLADWYQANRGWAHEIETR